MSCFSRASIVEAIRPYVGAVHTRHDLPALDPAMGYGIWRMTYHEELGMLTKPIRGERHWIPACAGVTFGNVKALRHNKKL